MKTCKTCGAELRETVRGRPRVYCAIRCKRDAENRARRVARMEARNALRELLERDPGAMDFARVAETFGRWQG